MRTPQIIEVVEITGAERERLLSIDEGHFVDLKSIEVPPKKLARAVSAFANTAGGDLYVGIAESEFMGVKVRNWRGFSDPEAANGHLQSLEPLFPLGSEYSYDFLRAPGSPGLVLHIIVQRAAHIVSAHENRVYVRRGAQNLELTSDSQIERLRLDKGVDTYERRTVDVAPTLVTESEAVGNYVKQVVPAVQPQHFLKKQSLLKDGKPVVAAVLLFADEPQAALPKQSGVKVFRYKTSGEGSRETLAKTPRSIEGPIYDLIKAAVRETVDTVEGIQKLGPSGLEPVKYPFDTLHEIVTNAILHRDYSLASDVQIRVFDNRVEVESPGILPGHVTVKNILFEQVARNGALVRLVNKYPEPPNQDVGEGLNTAFRAMQKLRLKPPLIEEKENSVLVTIRHDPLASPEESVMDYLQNHRQITNRIARELTGISSENTMKEVFYRLARSGQIQRVHGKKGAAAAWEKATAPSDADLEGTKPS